jgi:2-polyprenyl-3-methyl-5-hydroxy-6-metoxy-1,4-benzoquinol methylase
MEYYREHGIVSDLSKVHEGVRDNASIDVYQCAETGALVLSADVQHSYNSKGLHYWGAGDLSAAHILTARDDRRRARDVTGQVNARSVLDFGCGNGGFLQILSVADRDIDVSGVEVNTAAAEELRGMGIRTYASVDEIPQGTVFDRITMYHVLEHLSDPIAILRSLKRIMHGDTVVTIEVPHAKDALISMYECEAFKSFTFWSEHLILHTVESMTRLLDVAGLHVTKVEYVQRYNIFNHLRWLSSGEPGGHNTQLCYPALVDAYNHFLVEQKQTDTITIHCTL